MKEEIWIKIGLVGTDPQLGTLQGRINSESFGNVVIDDPVDRLNKAITQHTPIKLFDPIIFRAQRQGNEIMLGALALSKSMPVIEGSWLFLNPTNILWWAPLEETENWKDVVASTIHGIELAGGDMPSFGK